MHWQLNTLRQSSGNTWVSGFAVCVLVRKWESSRDSKRRDRHNIQTERKYKRKEKESLVWPWQPCGEDMVPLLYFLHRGTAFKLEFNITGSNLLASHTQTYTHTKFLASKNWTSAEKVLTSNKQSQSPKPRAHRGTSEKREKALCSDSLPQARPLPTSKGPDDTSRSHPRLSIQLVCWLVFPNRPVSLCWECIQETDT